MASGANPLFVLSFVVNLTFLLLEKRFGAVPTSQAREYSFVYRLYHGQGLPVSPTIYYKGPSTSKALIVYANF